MTKFAIVFAAFAFGLLTANAINKNAEESAKPLQTSVDIFRHD